MKDERLEKLASIIVGYSLKINRNEPVMISSESLIPKPLLKALVKEIIKVGGMPFISIYDPELAAYLSENNTIDRIKYIKKQLKYEVERYKSFINIKCNINDYENKNIPKENIRMLGEETKDIDDIKINKRKWVLLNYPSEVDAHKAMMKIEEFFDYALDAMTYDYSKLKEKVKPLKELMEKTDQVRITGPDTDLTFSIKKMNIVPCTGEKNIPDGEIYTAPIKNSVNGYITYNTPCPYQGSVFHNVKLTFKDGKIIEATCDDDNQKLNDIFDTDEGSRYVGEFSIGLNPKITKPMGDILYDEKIIGSLHFTPGRAYKDAYNGNDSSVHWDMVLIQTKEYGGGNIYFDDVLVREDGIFVLDELKDLN
jgi:aminopeptidase